MEMKRLTEFRVGRGHDGPARVGEFIMNDVTFETHILIGPESSRANPLHYKTLGRDSARQKPMISTIPFTMTPDELSNAGLDDSDSILLPSMISFSSLDDKAGNLLLRNQLEFIDAIKDTIDPSRLIIRVPENVDFEDFKSPLHDFHSKGIRAAAFTFDGLLGSVDLGSIHLRNTLQSFQ